MEDVAKIRYLVEDDKGRKFRRSVPLNLRALVGQTAWVERLGPISFVELKQRANQFGWRTDNEIRRFKAQLRSVGASSKGGASPPISIHLQLSDQVAGEIARAYFAETERCRIMSRAYSAPIDEVLRSDLIEEAGLDHAFALRAASGEEYLDESGGGSSTFATAWRLLAANGLLPRLEGRRKVYAHEVLAHDGFQFLCRLIERADLELSSRRFRALTSGNFPELQDDFFRLPHQTNNERCRTDPVSKRTVEDLIIAFEARKAQQVSASRLYQYRIAFRALREELGCDFPVVNVTRQHCQDLADLFVILPPYVTQHFDGHTLRSAADAFRTKNGVYASRAKEAHKPFANLKSIFDFAIRNDWIEKNPAAQVEILTPTRGEKKFIERSTGYQPFEMEELRMIFSAPLYTGCVDDEGGFNKPGLNVVKRHRYWVPLLALWTGMRMNEALQLERGDLKQQGSVYYLSVTDEDEVSPASDTSGKRVKNRNAIRDIPIHPELKRLGFIEWVQTRGPGRLFPEAAAAHSEKLSNQFSKRFRNFLESRGIWQPRKKVFHSFRNNFNDALRDGGVPEEIRRSINGWSEQASMDARYGRGHKVQRLFAGD